MEQKMKPTVPRGNRNSTRKCRLRRSLEAYSPQGKQELNKAMLFARALRSLQSPGETGTQRRSHWQYLMRKPTVPRGNRNSTASTAPTRATEAYSPQGKQELNGAHQSRA